MRWGTMTKLAGSLGLARERALVAIQKRLVEGHWPPGTVFQEQDLADELQLSKTPVREALLTLSMRDLVRAVPRVGYVVVGIELQDVADIFSVRTLMEGEIVTALASRGACLPPPREGCEPWEVERTFHAALAEIGAGPRMRRTLEELLDDSSRTIHTVNFPPESVHVLMEDHEAIAEAIRSRDGALARALITIHLTRLRESLMACLRQQLRNENRLA